MGQTLENKSVETIAAEKINETAKPIVSEVTEGAGSVSKPVVDAAKEAAGAVKEAAGAVKDVVVPPSK